MNIYTQKETHAYLYRWTELSTGKWYIGSRTAKKCHPKDGYICSSKIVKPLIESNPENWRHEILRVCCDPKHITNLEVRVLRRLNAKQDPMSYNMHNGDGKFTNLGQRPSKETTAKRIMTRQNKSAAEVEARIKKLSDRSKQFWENISAEAKAARIAKHIASMNAKTPEEKNTIRKNRSIAIKTAHQNRLPEDQAIINAKKSVAAKLRENNKTPEEKAIIAAKIAASAKIRWENMTPEDRSEIGKKGAASRLIIRNQKQQVDW